ncbi:Epoxyqueuosine (oQ) reductase QueG [Geitlerinema sp. FC II]|nr:Epoxyqueuosine (oQ) reductase QueG [Geitlerinema sp. FC II]
MVNFNLTKLGASQTTLLVSIPQRDFGEFQQKIGSLDGCDSMFQSLKGILVNFNRTQGNDRLDSQPVSIPQRDFGEFQRKTSKRD